MLAMFVTGTFSVPTHQALYSYLLASSASTALVLAHASQCLPSLSIFQPFCLTPLQQRWIQAWARLLLLLHLFPFHLAVVLRTCTWHGVCYCVLVVASLHVVSSFLPWCSVEICKVWAVYFYGLGRIPCRGVVTLNFSNSQVTCVSVKEQQCALC